MGLDFPRTLVCVRGLCGESPPSSGNESKEATLTTEIRWSNEGAVGSDILLKGWCGALRGGTSPLDLCGDSDRGKSTIDGVLLAGKMIGKDSKDGREWYTPDAMSYDLKDWAAPGHYEGLDQAATDVVTGLFGHPTMDLQSKYPSLLFSALQPIQGHPMCVRLCPLLLGVVAQCLTMPTGSSRTLKANSSTRTQLEPGRKRLRMY
jgi:hypothetical protein